MTALISAPATADPFVAALCRGGGAEVFNAVVHANQIWTADPFDVLTIHAEAREAFGRLVNRTVTATHLTYGKTLLLLGEAGSGKTHLMRAFRTEVHRERTGYCGYLQMTTRVDNYARYVLSKLLDSLDWPYAGGQSGGPLARLAAGLLDSLEGVAPQDRQALREEASSHTALADLVARLADAAVADPRYAAIDLYVVRAILYLLTPETRIRSRVMGWLRCEELPRRDRELIGELPSRHQDEAPLKMIAALGQLMGAVHNAALVLCVDQLEDTIDMSLAEEERHQMFRRAIDMLATICDEVPSAVVVIACLEDFYASGKHSLSKARLDRVEHDPEPIRLNSKRTLPEIEAILKQRLESLHDGRKPPTPIYPFTADDLKPLVGLRTRDVLDQCRRHQLRCAEAGQWVSPKWIPEEVTVAPPPELPREWSDFLSSFQAPSFDDEEETAELLGWAIEHIADELADGVHCGCQADGRMLPVEMHLPDNQVEKRLVGVCEKGAPGRGLLNELEAVHKRGGEIPAVIVRSTPFPASKTAGVNVYLGKKLAPNGNWRKVVVENAEWRAMAAFRQFWALNHTRPAFKDWQREHRPLSALPSLPVILKREALPLPRSKPSVTPPVDPPPTPQPAPVVAAPTITEVELGIKQGVVQEPVRVPVQELTRHAAFLGSPGSGKTTAALRIIEQLLAGGIPAVLIDRKGDLARYADPAVWDHADERSDERRGLGERVEVALYTPGSPAGRSLLLPLVPAGIARLAEAERRSIAEEIAAAIYGMIGYRGRGEEAKLVILTRALEMLAATTGRPLTVRALRTLINDQDEDLVAALDGYPEKHYKALAEHLLTLDMRHKRLFEGDGEALDFDRLLGKGKHARPGKTRLSIVNTQFLGGPGPTEFWVTQFLIALDRWRVANPAAQGKLQAVCLFDEAEQYLPATRQPATKGPLENLLRRARSAGVGLFLATQSPGDMDYKCRDQINLWLLGRIRMDRAIDKVKPMLEARPAAADKLPNMKTGEFYAVQEGGIAAVNVTPSLVKTEQLPEGRITELAHGTRGSK